MPCRRKAAVQNDGRSRAAGDRLDTATIFRRFDIDIPNLHAN
jgi:hypothetical protein